MAAIHTGTEANSPRVRSQPVRSKERFLVFGAPQIADAEIEEVVETLRSGWLGTGPKVAQFEDAMKAYKGAAHAVALNSCTAGLHLSLLAAGVGPGDEVITTPMTFCATVNTIIHAGATPVLADVDSASMNVDPAEVERRISARTRAIVPVHFAGRPCDMDALCAIAGRHRLVMIEDCAHAIETEYKGRKAGTFGDFGCLSFYATKNVVTGEGGMVLTRDEKSAARIRVLGLHGMSKDAWKRFGQEGYRHYQVEEAGFKYNMMDLQAGIGIHQLRRVDRNLERRAELWQRYTRELGALPLGLPADPEPHTRHGRHLYSILVDEKRTGVSRDDFLDAMIAHNIGIGVHYVSIPEHPYYQRRFGWRPEDFPNAMRIGRQTVSLPLSVKLTDDDQADVIEAVRRVLG